MNRPSRDQYFLRMAALVATRSTCVRRAVGCVLVDSLGRVLSTGYNGVPKDFAHCNEGNLCEGASAPSGTGLDLCSAIHAEQNAIMFCPDVSRIHICYLTVTPCVSCLKLLLNTDCEHIIALEEYPHPTASMTWRKAGRYWHIVKLPEA